MFIPDRYLQYKHVPANIIFVTLALESANLMIVLDEDVSFYRSSGLNNYSQVQPEVQRAALDSGYINCSRYQPRSPIFSKTRISHCNHYA